MEKKRSPRSSPRILPKSPLVYEKYKSGCAWRLIGFFNFRQGRSSKRLVSDRPRGHRDSFGNAYSRSQLDLLQRLHEKCQCTHNVNAQPIVEEEISRKPKTKRRSACPSERQHEKSDPKPVGELQNRETRSSKNLKEETCDKPVHGHSKVVVLGQKQSSSSEIEKSGKTLIKDSRMVLKKDWDRSCKGVDPDLDTRQEIKLQVCVNKAAESLLSRKPKDGSKHFLDALDILSSNKELFITLLQDPNSLSVKRIQDFGGSQPENPRAKSSSKGKILETQMKKPGESDRIVLLKPRLKSSDEDSVYLRFKRMAKKLKLVVGSNKDDGSENTVLHSIAEGSDGARQAAMTQRMEKTSDEIDSQPRTDASTSTTAHRSSELPVFKRKKRVESDVFNLSTESDVLPRRLLVEKQHDRTNSLPVFDNLHALSCYCRKGEHDSVASAQTRSYSLYGHYPGFEDRNWMLEHEKQSYRLCSPSKNVQVFKSSDTSVKRVSEFLDEDGCSGSQKTEETGSPRACTNLRTQTEDECSEQRYSEGLCSEPWLENYTTILETNTFSSDGSSPERPDSSTRDSKLEQEQPSPVSVLERIGMEDDIVSPGNLTPPSTVEQIGLSSDLNIRLRSVFEEGSVHKFVKKVLEASGLNWIDLLTKCTVSTEPSLFDEFSHDDHHQRLVLAHTREILHQMYQRHIKSSPFVSLKSPRLLPITLTNDLVHEVMKHIDWSLLCDSVLPRTLDELLERDLAKPGLWMDLGSEMEDIVADMAEQVLEELEMEIATELETMQTTIYDSLQVLQ